jgi:hypothetical protein
MGAKFKEINKLSFIGNIGKEFITGDLARTKLRFNSPAGAQRLPGRANTCWRPAIFY